MKTKMIENLLNKYNKNKKYKTSFDDFIMNAKRYVKATKERRMLCNIDTVSKSGMSRTIKFIEMQKNNTTKEHQLLNFYVLFDILGYQKVRDTDYFRIHGCGMDMVFNTNYNIIHNFAYMGIITKKTADKLAQITPHKI